MSTFPFFCFPAAILVSLIFFFFIFLFMPALCAQVRVTARADAASARTAGSGSGASSPGPVTWATPRAGSSARPPMESCAAEKVNRLFSAVVEEEEKKAAVFRSVTVFYLLNCNATAQNIPYVYSSITSRMSKKVLKTKWKASLLLQYSKSTNCSASLSVLNIL